ncbi:MAG: hypothetical protein SFV19_15055 [Rhodospirillaceae bacterium]|nr:hypothetical protein [Rhodospirillaceae bacterium]
MIAVGLGLSLAVAVIVVVLTRPWGKPERRAPLPWVLAATMGGFMALFGAVAYQDAIDQGLWTSASVTIGFAGAIAVAYSLLGYVTGRVLTGTIPAVNTARLGPMPMRALLGAAGVGLSLYWIGGDVLQWRDMTLAKHARRADLSPADVMALSEKVSTGAASEDEALAFLENPLCPPELLARFAGGTHDQRVAVARNKEVPVAVLETLSRDENPEVRWQVAGNTRLPAETLARLATDSHEWVRQTVTWQKALPDESFRALLQDADPQVRAAAARQPRQTDEELKRMLADPDESVQRAARFIADQRGWE